MMITNTKPNYGSAAVAYLSSDALSLQLFHDGKDRLLVKNHDLFENNSDLDSELINSFEKALPGLTQRKSALKLIVILSAELILYSKQEFPCGLSDKDLGDLFQMQIKQRTGTSLIETFYDYFPITHSESFNSYALFEARKDLLENVIMLLERCGFKITALIPQQVAVMNYVIENNKLTHCDYCTVCMFPKYSYRFEVLNNKIVQFSEIGVSQHFSVAENINITIEELTNRLVDNSDYPVILIGDEGNEITRRLADIGINTVKFYRQDSKSPFAHIVLKWMAEQYDLYQPVALA